MRSPNPKPKAPPMKPAAPAIRHSLNVAPDEAVIKALEIAEQLAKLEANLK